jgi:hypothetical protein
VSIRATLYNFKESRFTSLSHELRVFIYGADVTPWLKGDLSITYGNRDSFNNASFELANPRKLWQITRDNLNGVWREDIGEYSEIEKLSIFRWKNSSDINPGFSLNINATNLGDRIKGENAGTPGPNRAVPLDEDKEFRYRLAVNDCIFSRGDPLRIFMRNPYSSPESSSRLTQPTKPPTFASGQWVEVFCGFVNDHPVTSNYLTGESSCRVTGYCIRHLLTKMRVATNNIVSQADVGPLFDAGFFSDFISPSQGSHPFIATTLEKTIKSLILGTETPEVGKAAKIGNGLGSFKMGNVVCYDPRNPGNALELWHLMTMFGVNKVPYPSSAEDDLWLTTDEMEKMGRATIYTPDAYEQGPGGRYLHFLLPYEGTGAGTLVQGTINISSRLQEWTTRWEIIRDFASKLDFQVTTSPSGDILVEFPLYGFTPQVFSVKGGSATAESVAPTPTALTLFPDAYAAAADAANAAVSASEVDTKINRESMGDAPNGIGALLTFNLHQLEDTVNDEAEDFPTILQVDGGNALSNLEVSKTEDGNSEIRAYVYSPVLVARFGVISEQMQIPFAGQRSGDASGVDGPMSIRMAKLALIEYMKRLADAATWDGSVVFRPFLFPNRPVWLKRSSRIGLLTSVTNRWSIGKSASTNISLHMLMAERYNPDSGKAEYRLTTGAANCPISYADIWGEGNKVSGQERSGVRAVVGTTTPAKSGANGAAGSTGSGTATTESKSAASATEINDANLYGPFQKAMNEALKQAANEGMSITVTSKYRSPELQADMKKNPKAHGVARKANNSFVKVGEPWLSSHQYGMAVDVKIEGGKRADYQRFSEICLSKGPILWGQLYNGDYVHYEWNPAPGKTGQRANQMREELGYDVKGGKLVGPKGTYLQAVWDAFDKQLGTPTQTAQTPPLPNTTKTGTEDVKQAEQCQPAKLTEAGLTTMEDIANKIRAAAKRG